MKTVTKSKEPITAKQVVMECMEKLEVSSFSMLAKIFFVNKSTVTRWYQDDFFPCNRSIILFLAVSSMSRDDAMSFKQRALMLTDHSEIS